jgi:hypothetical protein
MENGCGRGPELDRHDGASQPEVLGDRRSDAARQRLAPALGQVQVENSTVLEQELFPISITLTGNVAVVQYNYQIARENHKKEREMVTGNYTDVLVKENGRWQFLTWSGGDQPKK